MRLKRNLILLFFILAGAMFGSLLAGVTRDVSFLSWLSYSQSVGIDVHNPALLDLFIVRLALGFELEVSIAQILCLFAALWGCKSVSGRI